MDNGERWRSESWPRFARTWVQPNCTWGLRTSTTQQLNIGREEGRLVERYAHLANPAEHYYQWILITCSMREDDLSCFPLTGQLLDISAIVSSSNSHRFSIIFLVLNMDLFSCRSSFTKTALIIPEAFFTKRSQSF